MVAAPAAAADPRGAAFGRLRDNRRRLVMDPPVPMRRAARVAASAWIVACLGAQVPAEPPGAALQARFRHAQQALAEHRYSAAAAAFETILELDPGLAGAHANLGVARFLQADYGRAAQAFRRALELDPAMRNVELYLGLSLARAGDPEDGLPALADGFWNADDDPWRLQAGMLLAELYAARRADGKLLEVVRALKRAFPRNADVLYLAYRLYSDLGAGAVADLAREAPGSARLHQVTAELLVSEGDYPRAVRQYRQALEVSPRLTGANRGLAVAIMNSNPDEAGIREAEEALERELALNPRDAESLYQLGEIAWRRGEEDRAMERYARAVELRPGFAEGLIGLGKALIARGAFDRAAGKLEEAVRLAPDNEAARYRLAQAYRQLGRLEEAASELDEFRRIRSSAEALGAIYRQVQRSAVADADLDSEASR